MKPEFVVTLWNCLNIKITVKELCNVLELPCSTFIGGYNEQNIL
ncbi:hypothetical protein B4158_5651 [Bacillus cereus]|nr:hypothetical protein B4158_5651 [Bacillus cereus]